MSVSVRKLTVLGEFKPFGLIAEAFDGKPPENQAEKYDYFLFDPDITRDIDGDACSESDVPIEGNRSDQELFIRGNRIIWSTGARVFKRFTLPSTVIKACWSRLVGSNTSQALLCVLQNDSLTICSVSGEIVSVPLFHRITSIWPLPFGLLLQQAAEEIFPTTHIPFSSASPFVGLHELSRHRREIGQSPQNNFSPLNAYDWIIKGEAASMSSHLILTDPLQEPHPTFTEERGKFNMMKDFNERTIWTSDHVPLMASYNKGKTQHSLWVAEIINSNLEEASGSLSDVAPAAVLLKQFSFRRIWQGNGAHSAACKVFLATDNDAAPVICFLLQEQKKLLSLRLQTVELNNEILFDVKPEMSWSIPAIAAAPVTVTRLRVRVGLLPHADIIVLAPDNSLMLYSGKQCLCRYMLPSCLGKAHLSQNLDFSERSSVSHGLKIIGLADPGDSRINVIMNNGQMFRCALRRSPTSSLANDCITAIAEGLTSDFYTHFLVLLWRDGDSAFLSEADTNVDSEWQSFCSIIMKMCGKSGGPLLKPKSSWEFLVNSKFHQNYRKLNCISEISSKTSSNLKVSDHTESNVKQPECLEKPFCSQQLLEILDSLHAVYESLRLESPRRRDLELLGLLLCDIAKFLGEKCYLDHYIRDFPRLAAKAGTCKPSFPQKTPPSLFRWLENCLRYGRTSEADDLPSLIYKEGCSVVSWARKIVSFYSILTGAKPVGKKLSSGFYCNVAKGSYFNNDQLTVLAMVGERFGLQQLDSLPSGVSLPLRHALDKCREAPPADWPAAVYVLLRREDLALSCLARTSKSKELTTQSSVNLVSMATPYMLHLHPVTIPSTVSDSVGFESSKFDETESIDGSMTDGMEHIFNSSTQLRYGRDLRLNENQSPERSHRDYSQTSAPSLVEQPVAIQTSINPSASDQDIQQAQLWQLAQRTTALPLGRAAFTLATIHTLLTEAFTVPKLILAGRLPAQQNATVNLDPNIRSIQEVKSWPEFHNAVAAGLRLAPLQEKMSRTWIIYNKPVEPNAVHAGLLLALGLHGNLSVLTISDIYQYLQQEHESTTVGLMLGLAASYRGTMQPAISKSLFVHIPARHPSAFPELELPNLLQSAAVMSVGLLYEGSAHPQTMQILLGEIGRRSGGDNVLEREGYAVSAGFSLGLVALGRGEDVLGTDTLVDRLFQYIGGKEFHNEKPISTTLQMEEHSRGVGQMMEGSTVNVDVTAPGAIIALALMFLKTESEAVVSRLCVPNTRFDLQYVRPDFIMLRVIARNLIMWNRVCPSKDWIQSQIPEIIQRGVKGLKDDMSDLDDMDAESFVQAYVNIVAGACISLGLRFAGTMDGNTQELLYEYAIYFLNEIKPLSATSDNSYPKGLSYYVDRGTLEICLHLIVLSLSVVMAGSGHLQTFRLLRFLRSRNSLDGHANFGIQMAVSLAVGFLFLGGGMRTFSTSNGSIAALLITLYPRLPTGPNDNRCHLQAFRHLYVLATEARWIQTIDVDTGLPVYAPLEVTTRETEHYSETSFCAVTPCILPERGILKRIRVYGPRYWSQTIELVPEDKPWWSALNNNDPFNSGSLYVKRKVGACSYVDDPVGSQSLLSRAMHKVFGLKSLRASDSNSDGQSGPGSVTVDQLVSTFSSDPSLIAFAQLCCNPSWNSRSDVDFQEFCLQVLFECVSKDRPALLQVYLSLYTMIGTLADQVSDGTIVMSDTLSISSLKLALAYNDALLNGRLTTSGSGIIQSTFLGSLKKRVEEILNSADGLKHNLHNYLKTGKWPFGEGEWERNSVLLSCYAQWYGLPAASIVQAAMEKIKTRSNSLSAIPLLRLLLPGTHIDAIREINNLYTSPS
ncbi:hypothetical protein ACFE04_030677 [Oxalis oulophora]